MWWILLCIVLIPLVGLPLLLTGLALWNYVYWRSKGFAAISVLAFWKSLVHVYFKTKSSGDMEELTYKYFSGRPFGGVLDIFGSTVWVMDPAHMKNIFVRDFDHFVDRTSDPGVIDPHDYNSQMVTNLAGQKWKSVRNVLTPTFTSGKMRRLFSPVCQCGGRLKSYLTRKAESGKEFEMKDTFGRYSMDVIASTAFGVDCNSYSDSEALFPRMANKLMSPGFIKLLVMLLKVLQPGIYRFVTNKMRVPLPDINSGNVFFADVVKSTVAERERSGVKGTDFLQLLLDAKKGELQEDTESDSVIGFQADSDRKGTEEPRTLSKARLTEPLVIAQSIIFFIAGYDTTANLLSFAMYELAVNPDVQEKLYEEVKEMADRNDGQLSYDDIMGMEYLDKVFQETLRLHPPAARLLRQCTKTYQIPGTNQTIEKGTSVIFPTFAIHRDERYYPNPTKFDPERFSPEEKAKRNPYVYQPFGHGPRNCIGMRFAQMEAKAALAMSVLNFRFHPSAKTQIPPKYKIGAVVLTARDGLWLRVEKRNN